MRVLGALVVVAGVALAVYSIVAAAGASTVGQTLAYLVPESCGCALVALGLRGWLR